jgi:hypothetical protein
MRIRNPLTGKFEPIAAVLQSLASQEGCDGEPYDEMVAAAEYIEKLEERLTELCRASERMLETANQLWWAQNPEEDLYREGPPMEEEQAQQEHSEAFMRVGRAIFNGREKLR